MRTNSSITKRTCNTEKFHFINEIHSPNGNIQKARLNERRVDPNRFFEKQKYGKTHRKNCRIEFSHHFANLHLKTHIKYENGWRTDG